MANFHSFSPNTVSGSTGYYPTIDLVSNDALTELDIIIKDSNTAASGQTLDAADSTTWAPINLSAASTVVTMRMRKIGDTTIVSSTICTIVQPYTDGHVIMSWGLAGLSGLVGDYEGEIEVAYATGKKLTVQDLLKFNIRADF